MDMNSVNPSQGVSTGVLNAEDGDSIGFREPPPPYTQTVTENVQPIRNQPTIIVPLKGSPIFYNCTKCKARVLTRVEYINNNKTHFFAGIICGLTTWCLLCCLAAIPYLAKQCKSANHYCPNCKSFLGSYSNC